MCQALRGRVNELEAELAEQSHLRLQAVGESEFLKAELDDLRRVREDTEKEQRSLTEIESKALFILHRHIIYSVNESNFWSWSSDIAASPAVCVCVSLYVFTRLLPGKAQANEQRYTKLKEKYTELVQSHADLLRKVRPSTS